MVQKQLVIHKERTDFVWKKRFLTDPQAKVPVIYDLPDDKPWLAEDITMNTKN